MNAQECGRQGRQVSRPMDEWENAGKGMHPLQEMIRGLEVEESHKVEWANWLRRYVWLAKKILFATVDPELRHFHPRSICQFSSYFLL